MTEVWRDIPGYAGLYQVSDQGRVKSLARVVIGGRGKLQQVAEKVLAQAKDSYGYHVVSLCGEKRKVAKVHRLVLLAFRGEPGLGQVGCHEDDNKSNNVLSNLKWGTHADNAKDRSRNGTKVGAAGAGNGMAKLTEAQVLDIRKMLGMGMSCLRVSAAYGVNAETIRKIKAGKTWSTV